MQLAVDFFPYFGRTAQLLDEDPTLYCVSSWNDNGQVLVASQLACCQHASLCLMTLEHLSGMSIRYTRQWHKGAQACAVSCSMRLGVM